MQVKDYKEGEHINAKLLVSSLVRGITNSGAPYLSLTLQDSSKAIDAKLWDVKPEIEKLLTVGKVFEFSLEINMYRNSLQAKVLGVLPVDEASVNLNDFVFSSPIGKDVLRDEIAVAVNSIQNENIARIVTAMLNVYGKDVYEYPAAAKIHHNFIGGLATHINGMIKLADALCVIYPELNHDYMVAGVILHDLGKIEEFTSAVVTEYSKEGKLLGHISIMDARLLEASKSLNLENSEELLLLRHMILSHHGQLEYGSPVRPMTLEAEMLTYIDNIDAKVNIVSKALSEVKPGEFTSKLFAMENRSFYKTK